MQYRSHCARSTPLRKSDRQATAGVDRSGKIYSVIMIVTRGEGSHQKFCPPDTLMTDSIFPLRSTPPVAVFGFRQPGAPERAQGEAMYCILFAQLVKRLCAQVFS